MQQTLIILWVVLQSIAGMAQSVSIKDQSRIQNSLREFLDANGAAISNKNITRKSEMFMLFLEVDSVGKISDTHLMHDSQNYDTVGAVLEKLTAAAFKKVILDSCRNKILILSITSLGIGDRPKERTYTEAVFWDLLWNRQRPTKVLQENGQSIFLSPFVY